MSAAEQEEPVGEHVQPRERHVGRADLQRHDHVGEADEQRRREHQQHDRAVHREQLVVLLVASTNCRPGRASSARISMAMQAADEEEHERGDQVEVPDRSCGRCWTTPLRRSTWPLRASARSVAGRDRDAASGDGGHWCGHPGVLRFRSAMYWSYSAGGDDLDREEHPGVVDAAELGAPAGVDAGLVGVSISNWLVPARDDVHA